MHFFKNAMKILSQRGHRVLVGARIKEFTLQLLNEAHLEYTTLTKKGTGPLGLIKELIEQQIKIAAIIRKTPVDLMLQISGIFNAPVGKCYGIPTLAFSDTENDRLANQISFSLSKYVISPCCFSKDAGGSWANQIHYPGYHELAYLSPKYAPEVMRPQNKFLVRFVGWGAGHDIGEKSLSIESKIELVQILSRFGSVHISSEAPLPEALAHLAFKMHPSKIHDFMATCKLIVGESATMASEAACMGIPAIFISNTGRGYTTEQDTRYDLVRHYRLDQWEEILQRVEELAQGDLYDEWQEKRRKMLSDKIDVTSWLVDLVEGYPGSIADAKRGSFEKYRIRGSV
jgi:predicted glycosyltransferase